MLARVFCMHMKLTEYKLLPNTPGIYYIKNTKNGKGYVGQSQNIRIRVRRHINLFKRKVYDAPLYKAFDKYGLDVFEVEVLLSITDLVDKFEIKTNNQIWCKNIDIILRKIIKRIQKSFSWV